MLKLVAVRLKTANAWFFVAMAIVGSVILTAMMNTIMIFIWWGKVSLDVLVIGSFNAFVVSLIVSPIVIFLLKHTARLEDTNAALKREVSVGKRVVETMPTVLAQSKRQQSELLALQQVGRALAASLNLQEIYRVMYREIALKLLRVPNFIIVLLDRETQTLRCGFAVADGEEMDTALFPPLPFAEGPVSQTIRTREPRLVDLNQMYHDPDSHAVMLGDGADPQSALYVPLISGNEAIGVMEVQHYQANFFQTTDMELLGTLANQAAVAIRNAQLFDLVQRHVGELEQRVIERARAEEALRQARDELESRVEERTFDLAEANENLQAEIGEHKQTADVLRHTNEKLQRLVSELEQRNHEVTLLNEMGDLLQACVSTQDAYDVVAQFAHKLFPNHSGALYIFKSSPHLAEAVAAWGEPLPHTRVFSPADCWALQRGRTNPMVDLGSSLICQPAGQTLPTRSLCLPLIAQDQPLGVLYLCGQPAKALPETADPLRIAESQNLVVTITEHIALALANLNLRETLRYQAIRDPLTGLFNRRYMEETLERELHRAARRSTHVGIIMLDIDHFKDFNDTFGHVAGDVVLREIGALLWGQVRGEDIACRYGGEEFIIILPEASVEYTAKRAEEFRLGIKELNVRHHDQFLGAVTLSLGVADFANHGLDAEAIVRAADGALYAAKRGGRDRVMVAAGAVAQGEDTERAIISI